MQKLIDFSISKIKTTCGFDRLKHMCRLNEYAIRAATPLRRLQAYFLP